MMINESWWVIPCYNEKDTLPQILNDLNKENIPESNIVIIDDGSTEGSVLELKENKPNELNILEHMKNLGQGAALRNGIDLALKSGAKYIITFDSDGQHQISDAIKMLKLIHENKKLDCILGSRFLGSTIGIPRTKKIALKTGILFTFLTTGHLFTDVHNGLRVFRRSILEKLKIKENRMAHASEILEFLVKSNSVFCEYPVTIKYSKYSLEKGQHWLNSFRIGVGILFSKIKKSLHL